MAYAIPTKINRTANMTVQMLALNKWTGLKTIYRPAASRIKNARPNDSNVIYLGKQPTRARYKRPTRKPVRSENLIMSYP